jgi:hypothetical protein
MASKSKIKGSSWERDCAKFLTELYGATFIRNITGSGAYIGGKNITRKANLTEGQIRSSKGDITPPDDWDQFNAEAKNYGELDFHNFYVGCRQLDVWLEQLITVADSNDFNILMFKITRRGKYVAVQPNQHLTFVNYTVYNSKTLGQWYITDFDEFFANNSKVVESLSKSLK